ncbi:DUF4974 domain-containing protein [Flavobacteriaceae bacterium F08102]|nr:DUF4974 domain-containing protein [Flavobacteriaceae bacterium F08102]
MRDQEILNYVKGNATVEEQRQLEQWIQASEENANYFNRLKAFYIATTFDTSINQNEVEQKLSSYLKKVSTNKLKVQTKSRRLYWYVAAAASVAVLIVLGTTNRKSQRDNLPKQVITKSPIQIGTDKATLTLEDGSIIPLGQGSQYSAENVISNGKQLIYNATQMANPDKIAYNTLTIPRGGQFYVKLNDGTRVWLNSESKLKYPTTFTKGEPRKVELLYGEAYFEVSPSTLHKGASFQVFSSDQKIEVLGTEFNVKAYREESDTYTTLVGGKVVINTKEQEQILIPNQRATVQNGKVVHVENVDVEDIISWKDGIFAFKNLSLKEIMKVLSRWYDVEVSFTNSSLKQVEFNGKLKKNLSIEEIMNTIKRTNHIDYKIVDKTIIFM